MQPSGNQFPTGWQSPQVWSPFPGHWLAPVNLGFAMPVMGTWSNETNPTESSRNLKRSRKDDPERKEKDKADDDNEMWNAEKKRILEKYYKIDHQCTELRSDLKKSKERETEEREGKEQFQKQILDLQAANRLCEEEKSKLEVDCLQLKGSLERFKKEKERNGAPVDQSIQTDETLDTEATGKERKGKHMRNEIKALKEALGWKKSFYELKEQTSNALEEEITKLELKTAENKKLTEELDRLKEELKEEKDRLLEKESENLELQEKCHVFEKQDADLKTSKIEAENLKQKVQELEKESENLKAKVQNLTASVQPKLAVESNKMKLLKTKLVILKNKSNELKLEVRNRGIMKREDFCQQTEALDFESKYEQLQQRMRDSENEFYQLLSAKDEMLAAVKTELARAQQQLQRVKMFVDVNSDL